MPYRNPRSSKARCSDGTQWPSCFFQDLIPPRHSSSSAESSFPDLASHSKTTAKRATRRTRPTTSFSGHPHAGGEISYQCGQLATLNGPSPRGWGNPRHAKLPRRPRRAIPTRVGKSSCRPWSNTPLPGHPHAGGEIRPKSGARNRSSGPSPRGWGNPAIQLLPHRLMRAIPTRVGKSDELDHRISVLAGHPHAGGEILSAAWNATSHPGPSPRGWGNLVSAAALEEASRAIPTRVGKSARRVAGDFGVAGHPHAGGEIFGGGSVGLSAAGPSPRGWGNRRVNRARCRLRRAIPTRVGKSCRRAATNKPLAGHPHAGGEIRHRVGVCQPCFGPSPRGWGNRVASLPQRFPPRAIPTRVGKSLLHEWVMGYVLSIREFLEGSQKGIFCSGIQLSAMRCKPLSSTSRRPDFPSGPMRSIM